MSFSYRLDASATCAGIRQNPMTLWVQIYSAGVDASNELTFSVPALAVVELYPGTTPDTLGGLAGSWNSATLAPFLASGTRNPQIAVQYDANYCSGGVTVDNIQLLASIPAPSTEPAVVPSCTTLPNLLGFDTTISFSWGSYTVRTFPGVLVIVDDLASSDGTMKVDGVPACQNLLAGTNDGQGYAQYDRSTGFCTVWTEGPLCGAYQLMQASGNYYAIGFVPVA
jgi:hypothetical protein